MITGSVATPAVDNIASVNGECHVGQLGGTQLGSIAGFAAGLAGLQILRRVGGLSKRQNRPEAKARYLRPETFSKTRFHNIVCLLNRLGGVVLAGR